MSSCLPVRTFSSNSCLGSPILTPPSPKGLAELGCWKQGGRTPQVGLSGFLADAGAGGPWASTTCWRQREWPPKLTPMPPSRKTLLLLLLKGPL